MSQQKARFRINRLKEVYNDVALFLSPADIEQYEFALEVYENLHARNRFAPKYAEELRTLKWTNDVNVRYGHLSIAGFIGEVLTVGLWNKNNTHTKFHLGTGEKTDEVNGRDVTATNIRWVKTFPVQVKLVKTLNNFPIYYDSWFHYLPSQLQRFVLADATHRRILHLDYEKFMYFCSGKRYIKLETLLKKTHIHPVVYS